MRSIIFDFADNNEQNLYIQIFDYIKGKILSGEFELGMKLPSLRQLAKKMVSVSLLLRPHTISCS